MRRWTIAACAAAALAAGCATPGDRPARLEVTLTGLQAVPGPGDPDGTGTAEVRVDPRQGRLCWNLYVRQIDPATAAHIHRGVAGSSGPPVVTLTTPDASGRSEGCVAVDQALAREVASRAYGFYVNVHTEPHPAGAIRGQLRGGTIQRQRRSQGG